MDREAIIIGGPNGAGKSTLAYEYLRSYDYPYVSADLIAADLNPDVPQSARVHAGRLFFERLDTLIENRESFIVESTLSGGSFQRVVGRLVDAGYTIQMAFVFLDTPALCVRRVKERVRRGGHDVPAEDIVRRYYRSKRNFWSVYRMLANRWYLYYNAGSSFEEVAVGEGDRYTTTDERLLARFLEDLI